MSSAMYEDSESTRARCHADITSALDRHYKNAGIDRRTLTQCEVMLRTAEAGEWKARDGQIMKGDKPVNASTLLFLSWCWLLVPALLLAFYKLESIAINLIAQTIAARAEENRAKEALDKHRAEIASGQTTGPDHEFNILLGCAKLGVYHETILADLFRRWLGGHSIEREILNDYTEALKRENALIGKLDGAPEMIKEYFRAHCRKVG